MNPEKDEIVVHGCHYPGDMAVRMRKALAIPQELKPREWCGVPYALSLSDH